MGAVVTAAAVAVSLCGCASVGSGSAVIGDVASTPPSAAESFETPTDPPESTIDPNAAKPTGGSISGGMPPTSAQVEDWVRESPGEFPQLDRIFVTTVSLDTISGFTSGTPYGYAPTDLVILGTGVGTFVPQFGQGSTYTWGTLMFDATNGRVMGSFAGPGDPPWVVMPG
ncbi:hypothetical protein B7R25_05255 [Subtercola boreus]|uniref:Uncharacterized protein n=1 Tax=Subtercola boreus TaxID=120213 RepID=A0A3E0WF76_9MICO|nr:hypothetical protein B7R24_05185 [Subtercola boreus]RFA28124.1 hypothetical protein B7R25_05255 [Subtercola boreus]